MTVELRRAFRDGPSVGLFQWPDAPGPPGENMSGVNAHGASWGLPFNMRGSYRRGAGAATSGPFALQDPEGQVTSGRRGCPRGRTSFWAGRAGFWALGLAVLRAAPRTARCRDFILSSHISPYATSSSGSAREGMKKPGLAGARRPRAWLPWISLELGKPWDCEYESPVNAQIRGSVLKFRIYLNL